VEHSSVSSLLSGSIVEYDLKLKHREFYCSYKHHTVIIVMNRIKKNNKIDSVGHMF